MHEHSAASTGNDLDGVRPPRRVAARPKSGVALVADGGFGTRYPGHVGTKSVAVALVVT
jgi:hypothetical protein